MVLKERMTRRENESRGRTIVFDWSEVRRAISWTSIGYWQLAANLNSRPVAPFRIHLHALETLYSVLPHIDILPLPSLSS